MSIVHNSRREISILIKNIGISTGIIDLLYCSTILDH